MKERLQGFIVGTIITVIMMSNFLLFADSIIQTIQVAFNKMNISVNGKLVKVDNILYNGTTYAPIKDIAEMLDKEVILDENINAISINDKVSIAERSEIVNKEKYTIVGEEYVPVVKINGKIYLFGYAPYFIADANNNYYLRLDVEPLNQILSIAYNQYKIEKSDNPYVNGYIEAKSSIYYKSEKYVPKNRYIEVENKYMSINQTYTEYKIYNSNKTRFYEISMKPSEEKGIIKVYDEIFIPFNELMNTLGGIQFHTETDEANKMQIFSFN